MPDDISLPRRNRVIGLVAVLAVAALVTVLTHLGSRRHTASAPEPFWQTIARSQVEASERYYPSKLGDLGTVADAVVIGHLVKFDGITQLRSADGSTDPNGTGPGVAHFAFAVEKTVAGSVHSPTPGQIQVVLLISSTQDSASSEGGTARALAAAPLPTLPLLLSLIWEVDPTAKNSGFYGEYSPSSSRGVIEAELTGGYTLPLSDSTESDDRWIKATLGTASPDPSTAIDDLGRRIAEARRLCIAGSGSCLARTAAAG
jgi:hypothetical protein